MHEVALAQSVISAIVDIGREAKQGRIKKVVVGVGELQSIDRELFKEVLEKVKSETEETRDIEIVVEIIPARFKCNVCGYEWEFKDLKDKLTDEERENVHFIPETVYLYVRCPECSSTDFEIIEGRGVFIERIESEY